MSIVAEELFRGRRGDAFSSREREYLVTGSGGDADLDETAAIVAATAISPASFSGTDGVLLLRTNAAINRHISNSQMAVTVQYGESGSHFAVSSTPSGTVEYEFNYQAPSEHIQQSLQTIGIWTKTGTLAPDTFGSAIGVSRNSDGTYDIAGFDTAPGNTTSVWSFTTTAATLASGFEQLVESMMGCVNSVPFRGRAAGTTRFVLCTSQFASGGSPTAGGKLQLRFGFQYSPNATNIRVGDITVPAKDGHDVLWVFRDLKDQAVVNPTTKLLVPYPKAAVVDRIYRRANFGLLGF